jgi:hypothetical protein
MIFVSKTLFFEPDASCALRREAIATLSPNNAATKKPGAKRRAFLYIAGA